MTTQSSTHKTIGLIGLTTAGLTCMVGSGWLFGSYQAAKIAGPLAILSWIIGGICIFLVALTYIELGTMFPRIGGMVRYMEYTHGSMAGFIAAWVSWLATVTVIPVEAVASTQYLSSMPWHWAHQLFNFQKNILSVFGLSVASALIVFYFLVNYWSVRLFIRFIVGITVIKILVPIMTMIGLFYTAFHATNFTVYHHNTLETYGWTAVLTAVPTSGIIFAFNGFQSIINLSGEAKNPDRNIALGILLSILMALLLYIGLQTVFIGALSPETLKNGWHALTFSSPFAQLAIALNLNVLALSLYFDAFLSPSGTATTYMGTTTRMLYGMSENGYMPRFMLFLHPKYQISRRALWTNLGISFLFLWLFKGWSQLVSVVSLAGVISYVTGPISSQSLRYLLPNYRRAIYMTGLHIFAPLAFLIVSLMLHWAKWPLTGKVLLIIASGLIVYVYYQYKQKWPNVKQQIYGGAWFVCYLISSALLSYFGSAQFGGIGNLGPISDLLVVCLVSLAFYFWGVKSAWMTPYLREISNHEYKP